MFAYVWPLALVVLSNTVYHVCAKSTPEGIHPMAGLTVTYLVAAAVSALLYFLMNPGGNLIKEYGGLNWTHFVLGVVIIGLEAGFVYAYRAGWEVSTASIVSTVVLTVLLIPVGAILYREGITPKKLLGLGISLIGLYLMNK